jgi:hypothetical protein
MSQQDKKQTQELTADDLEQVVGGASTSAVAAPTIGIDTVASAKAKACDKTGF